MARAFTSGQYLSAADNAANQISGTALTIACWVYLTSTSAASKIVFKGNTLTGGNNYDLGLWDFYDSLGHNRPVFTIVDSGYMNDGVTGTAGGRLSTNTWHHLAAVKNGTGASALEIFINGVSNITGASSRTMNPWAEPLGIGAAYNGSGYGDNFPGRIAEVAIWNAALSADEISALAKGYSPGFFRRANLRAYYPLIGRQSPEPDQSVFQRNATVTSATAADHPTRILYPVPPIVGIQGAAAPPAPVANFSASPTSGTAPLTVNFTDTSTNTPTSWAWDFTNDGSTDSTLQNPSNVYSSAGTYTVKLTATNAGGSDDEIKTGHITVSAPVVTPGIQYAVEMDFGRDGTFGHANAVITGTVRTASWALGMNDAFQEFATPSRMSMLITNDDGAWYPDKAGATYRGLLVPGVLVRLKAIWDGNTYTLWVGKVTEVSAVPGRFANESGSVKTVQISAEDAMLHLLDSEYVPTLLTEVRTDTAIRAAFDAGVFAYPYDKSWFHLDLSQLGLTRLWDTNGLIDFEQGASIVPWAGDNLDQGRGVSVQTYLREVVAAEAGGRFFWNGRTGKFAFHNRYHDAVVTPLATFGGDYLSGASAAFGKDLANTVTIEYTPRALGLPDSVIWELDTPTVIRPGETRVITARYRDPDNKSAKVSAIDVMPIRVSDIEAYEQIQLLGGKTAPLPPLGRSVRADVGVTHEAKVSSAKISVVNPLGVSIIVTGLKLRGTPLTTYTPDQITVRDQNSIRDYDKHETSYTIRAIDDPDFATNLANMHLMRKRKPVNRWEKATLKAGYLMTSTDEDYVQGQIVQRTIGDRVRMLETWSEHDAEYIIVGEQHSIDNSTAMHIATWTLKPAQTETWFKLDVSRLNSTDVLVF